MGEKTFKVPAQKGKATFLIKGVRRKKAIEVLQERALTRGRSTEKKGLGRKENQRKEIRLPKKKAEEGGFPRGES